MKTKIYLATDHAGFEYKNQVRDLLEREYGEKYEVVDCGSFVYDADDDYADFVHKAARQVSQKPNESKAIIFGGSGQGEAMLANGYPHVRATVFYGDEKNMKDIITVGREHNDSNILSIGARFVGEHILEEAIRIWLAGSFSPDEKYKRRITKSEKYKRSQYPLLKRIFG